MSLLSLLVEVGLKFLGGGAKYWPKRWGQGLYETLGLGSGFLPLVCGFAISSICDNSASPNLLLSLGFPELLLEP